MTTASTRMEYLSAIGFLDDTWDDAQRNGDGISTKDNVRMRAMMWEFVVLGGTYDEIVNVIKSTSALLCLRRLIEDPPKSRWTEDPPKP